ERIAWRIIAIVDPVFSLTLLAAIAFGWRKRNPRVSQVGLLLAGAYLFFGFWQHQNASDAALQLAEQRGHRVDRMMVKPTMANLILWRSVYEYDGIFYVDGIRIGPWSKSTVYAGGQAKRYIPTPNPDAALQHDIERFLYFSEDYVIVDPTRENVLIDLRYSMLPNGLSPLWGIDMNVSSPGQHAKFVNFRDGSSDTRKRFIEMLLGQD
ncbi:MAG: metal-dependent hydrolase, partial [Gammaproteobacteria bacterium]|nr:metal-dependent hydrolase [Gammaproteobacteria bacterium]